MALDEAASWIAEADAIVIGSGAGMGVDSGLGTFRGSKAGVWPGLEDIGLAYEEICQPTWFKKDPQLAWGFWNFCHSEYQAAAPHKGYDVVKSWMEAAPFGSFSFTSNIDSHWALSGLNEDRIVEVHGAVRWLQCAEPCCPDVWRAPADLDLHEDPVSHRVIGALPTCQKCGCVARPAVQMFGRDKAFSRQRRQMQVAKYDAWLKSLLSKPGAAKCRMVCVEIGCGLTVPTVRKELEDLMRRFPGARLIRINPESPGLAAALAKRGTSLPLAASIAIHSLTARMLNAQQLASFDLQGKEKIEGVQVSNSLDDAAKLKQSEDKGASAKAKMRHEEAMDKAPALANVEFTAEKEATEKEAAEKFAAAKKELANNIRNAWALKRQAPSETMYRLMLSMLDELIEGYAEKAFQQRLCEITRRQESGELQRAAAVAAKEELSFTVSLRVIQRYGFDGSRRGMVEMFSLFRFIDSADTEKARELRERGYECSWLAGMPPTPTWKPKRKFLPDDNEEDVSSSKNPASGVDGKSAVALLKTALRERRPAKVVDTVGKVEHVSAVKFQSRSEPESVPEPKSASEPESEVSPALSSKAARRRSQMAFT